MVAWWCGGMAFSRLKDASLDQQRCQLFPSAAIKHCNQALGEFLQKLDVIFL